MLLGFILNTAVSPTPGEIFSTLNELCYLLFPTNSSLIGGLVESHNWIARHPYLKLRVQTAPNRETAPFCTDNITNSQFWFARRPYLKLRVRTALNRETAPIEMVNVTHVKTPGGVDILKELHSMVFTLVVLCRLH
jgi:hypothetical protein